MTAKGLGSNDGIEPVEISPGGEAGRQKSAARRRADAIRAYRCQHLIAVIEEPSDYRNIGTIIRNVNAFGVEKVYVVDPHNALPDDWHGMREHKQLSKSSVSAVKWSFVKRFETTEACLDRLRTKGFVSIVTSPHVKGVKNADLDDVAYTIFPKLAVWFGSEAVGISDEAVRAAEMCISIPMFGMIESLNLGTTSGIVLHQVTKQRRAYQQRYRKKNRRGPIEEQLVADGDDQEMSATDRSGDGEDKGA